MVCSALSISLLRFVSFHLFLLICTRPVFINLFSIPYTLLLYRGAGGQGGRGGGGGRGAGGGGRGDRGQGGRGHWLILSSLYLLTFSISARLSLSSLYSHLAIYGYHSLPFPFIIVLLLHTLLRPLSSIYFQFPPSSPYLNALPNSLSPLTSPLSPPLPLPHPVCKSSACLRPPCGKYLDYMPSIGV